MKKIILPVFFIAICFNCFSQSFNTSASGTANITSVQNLSLTNLVNITNFSSISDYQNGVTTNNYATLAVKSNTPWRVSVAAQSPNFNPLSQGGSTDMPASVMAIRLTGATNFIMLSTTNTQLKTGNRGSASVSGNTFNIDLKFTPGFNYKGGQYTINLVYTLTAN